MRAATLALVAVLLAPAAGAELWRWTDAGGAVRYTPDPSRVPAERRGSLVKLEPGGALPEPVPPPSPSGPSVIYAPPDELPLDADPFNVPEPARTIEVRDVPEAPPAPVPGSPALAPGSTERALAPGSAEGATAPGPLEPTSRRAELEAQIAQDEAKLQELISRTADPGGDPLEQSPELREIARRLPALQVELRALDEARARREGRPAPRP